MNKFLLLLTILASSIVGYSQSEFCGHTDLESTIRAKDSMRYDAFQQNFRATINYFRKKQNNNFSLPNRQVGISISDSNVFNLVVSGSNCPKTKYIIPVVFHIVHNGGSSNIADAQIQHQLEELNKQFANYSLAGSKAVNTGIQFILANKDVNNNTITGITRHNSHLTNHRKITKTDSLMQFGIANLPMAKYLHIWVVNTILDASGTNIGVKAYATRPNSYFNGKEGVVIAYNWLGSYPIFGTPIDTNSKGSTLGHEIGHY